MPLANTPEGPCYFYRIPLRLGHFWARPEGKLAAVVTIGDDLPDAEIRTICPAGAKREGKRYVWAYAGMGPQEDPIVVVKGTCQGQETPKEVGKR